MPVDVLVQEEVAGFTEPSISDVSVQLQMPNLLKARGAAAAHPPPAPA